MTHTANSQTAKYVWDVNRSLPQVLMDGTNKYVYGLDLISATDGSGNQTYFTADGLGSTTDITDGNAVVTGTYSYDVFGAVRSQTGGGSNYWQFTGEQTDADSGLQYLRARYYDSGTGRFLGLDPMLGSVGRPSTQNRYAYVTNNPTNLVDPYGLFGWKDIKNAGKDLGGGVIDGGGDVIDAGGDVLNEAGNVAVTVGTEIYQAGDDIVSFLARFGTLNCLSAGLGITALALNVVAPGSGTVVSVGTALLFVGGRLGQSWLFTASSVVNGAQIKEGGVNWGDTVNFVSGGLDLAAATATLQTYAPRVGVGFGVASTAINGVQCVNDVIKG